MHFGRRPLRTLFFTTQISQRFRNYWGTLIFRQLSSMTGDNPGRRIAQFFEFNTKPSWQSFWPFNLASDSNTTLLNDPNPNLLHSVAEVLAYNFSACYWHPYSSAFGLSRTRPRVPWPSGAPSRTLRESGLSCFSQLIGIRSRIGHRFRLTHWRRH
jgi:hypothetical protein